MKKYIIWVNDFDHSGWLTAERKTTVDITKAAEFSWRQALDVLRSSYYIIESPLFQAL